MKKVLNVSFLKSQQSMKSVKIFNVHVLFFNICLSEILNLKKKLKKKFNVYEDKCHLITKDKIRISVSYYI